MTRVSSSGRRTSWAQTTRTRLRTTLKAEIDADAWATLHADTSRAFERPRSGRIAVQVINHLGDEVMRVFGTQGTREGPKGTTQK